jgi:hypothetical protein
MFGLDLGRIPDLACSIGNEEWRRRFSRDIPHPNLERKKQTDGIWPPANKVELSGLDGYMGREARPASLFSSLPNNSSICDNRTRGPSSLATTQSMASLPSRLP